MIYRISIILYRYTYRIVYDRYPALKVSNDVIWRFMTSQYAISCKLLLHVNGSPTRRTCKLIAFRWFLICSSLRLSEDVVLNGFDNYVRVLKIIISYPMFHKLDNTSMQYIANFSSCKNDNSGIYNCRSIYFSRFYFAQIRIVGTLRWF